MHSLMHTPTVHTAKAGRGLLGLGGGGCPCDTVQVQVQVQAEEGCHHAAAVGVGDGYGMAGQEGAAMSCRLGHNMCAW